MTAANMSGVSLGNLAFRNVVGCSATLELRASVRDGSTPGGGVLGIHACVPDVYQKLK